MGVEPTSLRDLVKCSNHWTTRDSMVSKGRCFSQNLHLITSTQRKYSVRSLMNLLELPFCLSVQPACHLLQIQHLQLLLRRPLKRIATSPIVSESCPQAWESGCHSQNSCFCLLYMNVYQQNNYLELGYILFILFCFRRRANARNVSFRISLRWLIHIINLVDKTQLSRYTSHRRSTTVSLETYSSKEKLDFDHC